MLRDGLYDDLSRVRPPQQDRSRRAQQGALDAFEALLAERPLSRVTMQEVADRAGLSITSVYARFDGKDALVLALHERVIGGHRPVRRRPERAVDGRTPVEESWPPWSTGPSPSLTLMPTCSAPSCWPATTRRTSVPPPSYERVANASPMPWCFA
ncbi:MAG: helix-turn-helix domain-containing protein [Acidimicrobiales bacterium]